MIVWEDENLVVVDKPWDWVATNEGRWREKSIETWAGRELGIDLPRSGVVNRLDIGTSGLMLVAKSGEVMVKLKKMTKERRIKKTYWAIVCGRTTASGDICWPIGRKAGIRGRPFRVDIDGKRSVTRFERLGEKQAVDGGVVSWLEIGLLTGRTHQIRAHLSFLGWPVLGDVRYGGWKDVSAKGRFWLHSRRLEFDHPITQEKMMVEANKPGGWVF